MRMTLGRLMFVVACEAVLARASIALAIYRGLPMMFREIFGIWFTLNLMSVMPCVIWSLRSRHRVSRPQPQFPASPREPAHP
jgi:hypothetical protein